MNGQSLTLIPAFEAIARRLFWWKTPEDALSDQIRFVCQVMTLGTWEDISTVRRELGDAAFLQALQYAPPGVFDARSWNYWHLVFAIRPTPPMPVRTFK